MKITLSALGLALVIADHVAAQSARPRLGLDTAAAADVRIRTGIAYADTRLYDLYLPPRAARSPLPVVIFASSGNLRANTQHQAWARLVAAHGMAAVTYDGRFQQLGVDLDALMASLAAGSAGPEVDAGNVAWWLASGIAFEGLPLAMAPGRESLRSVAAYYGAPLGLSTFRLDRPLLLVRVGMDEVSLNRSLDSLVGRALAANAPVTIINHPAGYHPFEEDDSTGPARYAMEQTIGFFRATMRPGYQRDVRAAAAGEGAVGQARYAGDGARAAAIIAPMVAADTGNAELVRQHAMAQLMSGQYREANASFTRARALRHWRRGDIAVGGISACWRLGDRDCVREWIATLPARWDRTDLLRRDEFADLRDNSEFVEVLTGRAR